MMTTPKSGSGATRIGLLALAVGLLLAVLFVILRRDSWQSILSRMSSPSDVREHEIDPEIRKVLDHAAGEVRAGHFDQAESELRDLVRHAERSHGSQSVEVGLALTELVDVMVRDGKAMSPECLDLAERAAGIMENVQDVRFARSLERKAAVLRERGRLKDARTCLEQAVSFQKAYALPDTQGVVQNLAVVYTEQGFYDDARGLLEQKIAEETGKVPSQKLLFSRHALARLLTRMGEYSDAERLYDETIASADEPLRRAFLLNGKANLEEEIGDYPKAQELYEEAQETAEQVGPNQAIVGAILNNLGYLYLKMGDPPKAQEYYQRSLDFNRKTHGENSAPVAGSMGNLASIYCLEGNYAEAEQLYLRALHLREQLVGADHPTVASSLHDLGELYLKTSRPARAVPLFERALAIHQQQRHVDTWESLAGLAKARDAMGERATAGKLYAEALAAIQKVAGGESERCVPAMRDLAWFYDRTGKPSDGFDLAIAAEALSMEHARLMASALPDEQARRYAVVRADGLNLALSMAVADSLPVAARVWDVVVQSRALVLDEIAARRRALRFDDPETQRIAGEYEVASRRLAHLMVGSATGEAAAGQLAEARAERERCERELAAHSSAFKAIDARRHLGLADVRASLPAESGLVAFVRYQFWSPTLGAMGADANAIRRGDVDQEYLAFVLPSPSAPPEVVPLGKAAPIDSLVRAWSKSIERAPLARDRAAARMAYREVGAQLRQALWDPIAGRLGNARTVFIVPDGAIHRISLAVLPEGGDRYLIES
ncbi:MAG TPA: tetratricopeptide repeat protein, partial [Candidatus Udaeobacter sp.]|nr:tetratricopeptide repeat protein [Candidatus Udaeobacter sp.]